MLPYAWPGILGGCFIALGRALGETMAVTMLIGNRPDISLSPFAMGNSIASVIANEFTEATYDLYLSALVELGLVLLLVSMAMNSLARLLIWRVSGGGSGRSFFVWNLLFRERTPMAPTATEVAEELAPVPGLPTPEAPQAAVAKPHSSTRSPVLWPASHHGNAVRVDRLMTGVLELCLVITVVPLFLILGYLIYRGVGALNWNFFVKLPAPVGQAGGGMANALYGSLLLVGLATLFAVPVGLFAAIYLAEYRSVRLGPAVRFIGELLGGVPSIVIGIFAYAVVVKPMGYFSGWAGGFALGVMMIPIFMRVAEESLRMVPRTTAARATPWGPAAGK